MPKNNKKFKEKTVEGEQAEDYFYYVDEFEEREVISGYTTQRQQSLQDDEDTRINLWN